MRMLCINVRWAANRCACELDASEPSKAHLHQVAVFRDGLQPRSLPTGHQGINITR